MAARKGRDPPPHPDGGGIRATGQLEGDAAAEGPLQRGVPAEPVAEAECLGGVIDLEVGPTGAGVETGRDVT